MKKEVLEYVDKQLTYHGFSSEIKELVRNELINNPKPALEISGVMKHTNHATKQEVDIRYNLNFAVKGDKVYFNNYTASLADREIKVHIGSSKNITAKESFNLLQERSVYRPEILSKEGEKFSSWVKIDFKQKLENGQPKMLFYNQNYGYDLKRAVSKFDIKEMKNPKAQANILNSLERGNLQAVTLVTKEGEEKKMFIEAQPQFKNVNFYSQDGQKLNLKPEIQDQRKSGGAPNEVVALDENLPQKKVKAKI